MSQYIASLPSDGRKDVQAYFENFYKVSDNPEAHEEYSKLFTENAKVILGPNTANGRSGTSTCFDPVLSPIRCLHMRVEIVKMRHGMWEKVASRSHKPGKIYSFGADADDVMLDGTVDFVLKDGKKAGFEWGGRAHFTKEDEGLKMDFYQVYFVSLEISNGVRCYY